MTPSGLNGASFVPVFTLICGLACLWYALLGVRDRAISIRNVFGRGSSTYTLASEPLRFGCSVLFFLLIAAAFVGVGVADLWMAANVETWMVAAMSAASLLMLWRSISDARPRVGELLGPITAAVAERDFEGAARLASSAGAISRFARDVLAGSARPPRAGGYRADDGDGAEQVRERLPMILHRERRRAAALAAVAISCALGGMSVVLARGQARGPWPLSFSTAAAVAALAAGLLARRTRRELEVAAKEVARAVDGGREKSTSTG